MSNPHDNASERISVLGPTLQFKGELHAGGGRSRAFRSKNRECKKGP